MDQACKNFDSPRWVWIAAIWGGTALFDASQNVFVMKAEGTHHYWAWLFFTLLVAWLPWALSTRSDYSESRIRSYRFER